jgi:ABC-type antimicrobial peptide transport system permease subunit
MVLREALRLVLIGVAVGIPVAVAAARLIASMLFAVKTSDPLTVSVAILGMFVTAVVATWIPCARATRVDPIVALRFE